MMNVLVTGASGLLGGNFCYLYGGKYRLTACFHQHPVSIPKCLMRQIDLLDASGVEQLFEQTQPDVVIHSAAYTNVDQCETDVHLARRLNVDVAHELAKLSKKCGAKFILISTDSVFSQGGSVPFQEGDVPGPKSVYSRTKLEGEEKVRTLLPNAVVIRTAFYGYNILNKLSLGEWVIDRLRKHERVPGFNDVFFSPIEACDLSKAIDLCIDKDLKGLYHIGSSDYVSKHDFARRIALKFGHSADLIESVSIASQSQLRAYRPRWTVLEVGKFEKDSGYKLPTVDRGVECFAALSRQGYPQQLRNCNLTKNQV